MSQTLQVACLQTRPMARFDEAIAEALSLAQQAVADGARLLCLPEYCGGLASREGALTPPSARESEHPVVAALRSFAKQHQVWMLIGSVAIENTDSRIVNRGFVIDDSGAINARYDKIHLFDVDLSPTESYRESAFIDAGAQAVLARLPDAVMGLSICYDLRFPALYRDLAQAGAELLVVPAAFTKVTGEAHWHVLNRARAIETGSFVIAPCAVGPVPGGGESYGHSLVVDPWGVVLADGGDQPGIVRAKLDLGAVAAARARIPSLQHDRPFTSPAAASLAQAS